MTVQTLSSTTTSQRSAQPGSLAALVEEGHAAEREGAWDDALARYETAFARLHREGDAGSAAALLRWIGTVHRERGETELAQELYEASLAVAEASGRTDHVAAACNCLALAEQLRGRLDLAESHFSRARVLAAQVGDERLAAMVDQNLGTLANIHGDLEGALARYGSALERYRRLGDDWAAARALNCMGMAHVDRAEWEAAERCYDEAFRLADSLRDTAMVGTIELNRAELYLQRREFARARECCDRAFEIFTTLQSRSGQAEAHKFHGVIYRETGKRHLSDLSFGLAVDLARTCQDALLEAESHTEWALLHLLEERNREALQCLNAAHRLFTELGARREISDVERRLERLVDTCLRVVRAWGESIETKDRYTAGHCERVAEYTVLLARAVGFEEQDLTWLRMGAFLHDVGKTAVPAEVLNKPAALSPEEWELMRSHTVVGDGIVAELNFPWDIRPIVRNHHERWDGRGYPDGLAGEEIPLTARVLCVADVYDALTTARSYRPALSQDEALRIMHADAGRILDPTLFRAFRGALRASAARG